MKDRILDAAYEILSDEGSTALTTRRVCDAVGITMPTLYHYFSSRDVLVRAVYEAALQRFMTRKRSLKLTDDPLGDFLELSNALAKRELGYAPEVSRSAGISHMRAAADTVGVGTRPSLHLIAQ